jgi:hypothetical protein
MHKEKLHILVGTYEDMQIEDCNVREACAVNGRSACVILIQTPEGKISQTGT